MVQIPPPLNLLNLQREQEKDPGKINSKMSAYILDLGYGHSKQAFDKVEIICYDRKIYGLQTLHRRVLDWYNFYLNLPGCIILSKIIQEE